MTHDFRNRKDWAILGITLLLLLLSAAVFLQKSRAWKPPPNVVAAPRKPRTYRLRGIPVGLSEDELSTQLKLDARRAPLHLTLAPGSQKRAVATFSYQQAPDVSRTDYVVDTDFFGITPLTNPAHATVE